MLSCYKCAKSQITEEHFFALLQSVLFAVVPKTNLQ